jgi:hypothetical protein
MTKQAIMIAIRAPVEIVWSLLTDAANYPQWSSMLDKVDGRIAAGECLVLRPKVAPTLALPVRVIEFAPPQKMVWSGGVPLGLLRANLSFVLTPAANDQIGFAVEADYVGLLARSIPDLQPTFETFAAELSRRAESLTQPIQGEV